MPFHPELRSIRFMPRVSAGPGLASFANRMIKYLRPPKVPGVSVENRTLPQAPEVGVRIYRPEGLKTPAPALLWVHGGGYILGAPEQDELSSASFAKDLGIVVVAVRYRLSPRHPFPTPVEDCYSALSWLHSNAAQLGVRADRIAIGGASAGGGLAAGLALLAHDREGAKPVFQLLVYPMIDDRTTLRTDIDGTNLRLWSERSNVYGWSSYLGHAPGGANTPAYAAASRREHLEGLPPAWVGVGTYDLFHDEDVAYAKRLNDAGVATEVNVVPGAFHGFDAVFAKTKVVREFRASQTDALRRALFA